MKKKISYDTNFNLIHFFLIIKSLAESLTKKSTKSTKPTSNAASTTKKSARTHSNPKTYTRTKKTTASTP